MIRVPARHNGSLAARPPSSLTASASAAAMGGVPDYSPDNGGGSHHHDPSISRSRPGAAQGISSSSHGLVMMRPLSAAGVNRNSAASASVSSGSTCRQQDDATTMSTAADRRQRWSTVQCIVAAFRAPAASPSPRRAQSSRLPLLGGRGERQSSATRAGARLKSPRRVGVNARRPWTPSHASVDRSTV